MAYTNPTQILVDAAKYPAALEAKLPEQLPRISGTLIDTANKLPVLPDFPMEIPGMPAPPELPDLPDLPEFPGGGAGLPFVTKATVTPVNSRITREVIPSPAVGVLPEVKTRRGM